MKIVWILVGIILISSITIMIVKSSLQFEPEKGIQQSTYDLVKQFEGEELKPYKDSVGIDTIGIGHVILPNENDLRKGITARKSYELFLKDSKIAEKQIRKYIKFPLSQKQFDALVSLVYNIGIGSFQSSTILKQLNSFYPDGFDENETYQLKNSWLAWKNAGGKPILLERRIKEFNHFIS